MQNSVSLARLVPSLHQKENEAALCVCIDYTEIFPVTDARCALCGAANKVN